MVLIQCDPRTREVAAGVSNVADDGTLGYRRAYRQHDSKSGMTGLAFNDYLAVVLGDYLLHDRQPKPRAATLLGGKERVEDQIELVFRDSFATISQVYHYRIAGLVSCYSKLSAERHRIKTVVYQVDKNLL